MKIQFLALPELQDVVLQTRLLVHDEEIGFLGDSGVNLEEELVVDEGFNRAFKVVCREIGVNEGIIEDLAPEKVIYLQWWLACDTRCDSCCVIGVWGRILTLPELDLEKIHLITVEISEDVIIGVVNQAGVVVDPILLNLILIHIVKMLVSTLGKVQICSILNSFSSLYTLLDIFDGEES